MKNFLIKSLYLSGFLFLALGCAHGDLQKKLDDKLSKEDVVKNQADLRFEINQLIEKAPDLTDDQRTRLRDLSRETSSQVDDIWSQSLKLRSVLIKDLINSNYDEDEAELIKSRLKDLEGKRLNTIFGAVNKANSILGRQANQNQPLVRGLFELHGKRNN